MQAVLNKDRVQALPLLFLKLFYLLYILFLCASPVNRHTQRKYSLHHKMQGVKIRCWNKPANKIRLLFSALTYSAEL